MGEDKSRDAKHIAPSAKAQEGQEVFSSAVNSTVTVPSGDPILDPSLVFSEARKGPPPQEPQEMRHILAFLLQGILRPTS